MTRSYPHSVGRERCCEMGLMRVFAGVDSWGVQGQRGSTSQGLENFQM